LQRAHRWIAEQQDDGCDVTVDRFVRRQQRRRRDAVPAPRGLS
jgi:hypothetical protein